MELPVELPVVIAGVKKSRCLGPCTGTKSQVPGVLLVPCAPVTNDEYKAAARVTRKTAFVQTESSKSAEKRGGNPISGFSYCTVDCAATQARFMQSNESLAAYIEGSEGRLGRPREAGETFVISLAFGLASSWSRAEARRKEPEHVSGSRRSNEALAKNERSGP